VSTAYLTTGWEPDLSDDDSICLRWLRHWSAQLAAFAEAAGGRVVHDERYLLADHGRPASYFNAAVLLTPWSDDAAFGAVVDEIEARAEGYPMDDLQPFRPGTLAAPALLDDPRLRFWTSSEGGTAVTASAQFVTHGLAGFAMGVTLPGHRHAGHRALHVQLRLALESDLWHVGVFSDHSRAGVESAGFTPVVRHTLSHRTR
jgi:hypothetical protein